MSADDLRAFVERRRTARLVTPKRKVRTKTIKGLAKAWGIPEGAVEAAVNEQFELFKDAASLAIHPPTLFKTFNDQETQCPTVSKKSSKDKP